MIEIKYKSKNAVVIFKPFGMPSQSDASGDADAMSETSRILKESGEDGSLWLIHRLDRGVGGLMVFARNKECAAELSETVRARRLSKEYMAVVEGVPESEGEFTDFLYKDAKTGKAYIAKTLRKGVKEAKLEYKVLRTVNVNVNGAEKSLVYVKLHTGRFHQIRVQFSSRHHSLVGDKKYGNKDAKTRQIALCAVRLQAELSGEIIDVSVCPPINLYPWNLFSKDGY